MVSSALMERIHSGLAQLLTRENFYLPVLERSAGGLCLVIDRGHLWEHIDAEYARVSGSFSYVTKPGRYVRTNPDELKLDRYDDQTLIEMAQRITDALSGVEMVREK